MKALQIKYLSPTNHRPSRLKLIAGSGLKPVIESLDYSMNIEQQAEKMAGDYAASRWNCKLTGFGTLPNGDYAATIGSN